MKKNTLKTILIILIIVLLGLVSFGGIYLKNLNTMKNVVKEYNYRMDFSKTLIIGLKVQEEEKQENAETDENEEEQSEENKTEENKTEETVITKENVKSAKQKIKNRLVALGVEEFYIRANNDDGSVLIELPDGTDTGFISDVIAVGEFKIEDSDGNVLGGSDSIKDVRYTLDRTTYKVPCIKVEIEFKKDFAKNLVTNQKNYEATIDENGKAVTKQINLTIDGTSIYSDAGTNIIDNIKLSNTLTLFLGRANMTEEELQNTYNSAAILSTMIKDGKMPIEYKISLTDILTSDLSINSVVVVGLVVLGLATIWAIYKYKTKGVLSIISLIGYIAVMLLLIRYTNVILAFEGIFALALIFGIEYVFNLKFISNVQGSKEKMIKAYSKTLLQFLNVFVVSFIIAIVFSMQTWVPIKSFGTIMFWGIIILVAYNYLVTKNLIGSEQNKK